jgi:hypothetical protein
MEVDREEYSRRKERIALVVIVVVASVAVASLLVAFSYYCYIRNKVSKRLKDLQSEPHFHFYSLPIFAFAFLYYLPADEHNKILVLVEIVLSFSQYPNTMSVFLFYFNSRMFQFFCCFPFSFFFTLRLVAENTCPKIWRN